MMISLPAKLLDATADLLALALVFDLAEPAGPLQLLSPHSFHHSENDFWQGHLSVISVCGIGLLNNYDTFDNF